MTDTGDTHWQTHRGDEWWWSGTADRQGSCSTQSFYIDDLEDCAREELWKLLVATHAQFAELQILCAYNSRIRELLDELQRDGFLRWSDIGNPHSRYARIDFIKQ